MLLLALSTAQARQPQSFGAGHRGAEGGRLVDVFIAWAPSKTVSLTATWVALGRIAPAVQPRRQHGATCLFNWRIDPCVLSSSCAAFAVGTPAVRAQNADPLQAFGGMSGLNALMLASTPAQPTPASGISSKMSKAHPLPRRWTSRPGAGWPCQHKGAPMKLLHQEFEIRASDFNALVELLQAAMDARHPLAVQNRLLARFAPMHRTSSTSADAFWA